MVLACIDISVAYHLLDILNKAPDGASESVRNGSRQSMTDSSGAVVTGWRFTCTSDQAMIIRVELCAAAVAARESNPELSKELLKAERVVARAMRER